MVAELRSKRGGLRYQPCDGACGSGTVPIVWRVSLPGKACKLRRRQGHRRHASHVVGGFLRRGCGLENQAAIAAEGGNPALEVGRVLLHLRRLEAASGRPGIGPLRIVTLPFPRPVVMNGERLPASYANFYIANDVVLVPTFNDPQDRVALNTLASLMPTRRIVGIHAVDLVWGLGTLHCLTQQQPAGRVQGR